jgi:hypothetical protein
VVSVQAETALAIDPLGRQVEVLKNNTTAGTGFRRIRRVYEGNHTPGTFSLVREELPKHRPTTVENALAEMLVASHIPNAQIFQRNAVILPHEFGRQFVRKVAALAGNMFMLPLDCQQLLSPVLSQTCLGAALFRAGKSALQQAQPLLPGAVVVWVRNLFAVAGSDEGRYAHVDTDNALLRAALYFPAMVALRHNPIIRAFGERLKASGHAPKSIIGAAMRKLLHLVFGVLKSGRPFDPAYSSQALA